MIGAEYFDEPSEAELVLGRMGKILEEITGHPSRMRLLGELDTSTEQRILQLKEEVFRGGPDVFDRRDLSEVTADPDSLFIVLEIDGSIEGYCFGYYEEPGLETVAGTDFFLDTALCSLTWQNHGIAEITGAGVLLLVDLLGNVNRVGIQVWDGGRAADLIRFYRRFGFVEAESPRGRYASMTVNLDAGQVDHWRAALGLPARTARI